MVIQLIQNAALLISMSLLQGLAIRLFRSRGKVFQLVSGLIYAGIAIAGMNMPFTLEPGVFYDGRSIVMVLAGLFGGKLAVIVTVALTALYRVSLGGTGVWAGLATIVFCALAGALFRYLYDNKPEKIRLLPLWGIGMVAHFFMLGSQLLLPSGPEIIGKIWLPILLVFPFATLMIGVLLGNEEKRLLGEKQVKESERLYRTTLYSIGDAVITTDLNARVQLMNPVAEKLTGWTELEARNKDIGEVFHIVNEQSRSSVECPVKRVIREGAIVGLANHTVLISRNGVEYPIADSGAPIWTDTGQLQGVVLVFRDMTEEVRQQQALDAQKKLFETMFNAISDGIVITDTNRQIVLANEGVKQTYGYEPDELIGKSAEVLYASAGMFDKAGKKIFDENVPGGSKLYVADYKTKGGRYFSGETFGAKLYDGQGKWIGNLGITRDITERLQSRKALERSEERYKYLFENNPMPMWIYDPENLKILMVNPAAIEQYGYTREEFMRMTLKDIRPVEDVQSLLQDVEETRSKLNHAGVWRHLKKNGEIIHADIISHLIDYEGKPARLVLAQDVSQRIEAMQALRVSEENYRNLFENHSAVKLIIHPVDGTILNANPAAARFYGWSVDELKRMTIQQINTLNEAQVQAELERAKRERTIHFEFRHRLASGSVRDVEVFSSLIKFQGTDCLHSIIHDVSAKKEAERRLQLFNQAIQQNPISIVITDPEGQIEYVNPKFTEVTGYRLDEAIRKNMSINSSGLHTAEFYHHLWQVIKSGQNWVGEFRNRKKSGELYWEKAIISPIIGDNGEITNYIGIKEDITGRKQMIRELVEAKEKAEESERLKSAFLANMSHEIRTPLNVILGFTEMLVSDQQMAADKKQEFSLIINKSAEGLLEIINDVLDASKLETGQVAINFAPVVLGPMLQRLHTQFARRLAEDGKGLVNLRLLPGFETQTISADEYRLSQILGNLLSNAVKFTAVGEIVFGVSEVEDGQVTFIVSDTGIGIPEKDQSHIFERFRQAQMSTSRIYGGTGLGLSITKNLLELMGGHIELQSEEGKGTTFRFYLPIKQ
ncbi:MAG: PAS domain S-box protein [Mangrovibacterium sp.]